MAEVPDSSATAPRIGLIAGAGHLPEEAIRRLSARGTPAVAYGFEGITEQGIGAAERRTKLGQLARLCEMLRRDGIERLLIVGRFSTTILSESSDLLDLDEAALGVLRAAGDGQDVGLMAAIGSWLEDQGFVIGRQDELLEAMLARKDWRVSRAPDRGERADAVVGRAAAAALGRSGAGQAVAVKNGTVVAVEAREGTDEMIRRAGELGGPGVTLVKGARPGQDRRFDLPAIGPGTIAAMCAARAGALAVEAGSTLIIDQEGVRAAAEAADIALWAFDPQEAVS